MDFNHLVLYSKIMNVFHTRFQVLVIFIISFQLCYFVKKIYHENWKANSREDAKMIAESAIDSAKSN